MAKLRIAILRGGPSFQYDDSIKTGATIINYLRENYHAHDIFISKSGEWHRDGAVRTPERALAGIDLVFNALHGNYGEDGKIQKTLRHLNIPHTGSSSLSSALGMNKVLSKKILHEQGIKTPYYTVVKNTDDLKEKYDHIYHHFYLPIIVKPATGGGSKGMTVVKDFRHLIDALHNAFNYSDSVLIEEFIRGKEATVGVIDNFRDQQHYVLLPVEHSFESETNKASKSQNAQQQQNSTGENLEERLKRVLQAPGNFSPIEKQLLQDAARKIHKALNLRHYSQSDFIVTPRRGIYFLEANSQPLLHEDAPFAKSLESVGSSLPEFIFHILKQAREEY